MASMLLRSSGVLHPVSIFVRNVPRILMYHRFQRHDGGLWPSADLFGEHVRYVSSHYRTMSMSGLHSALLSGDVPPRTVVFTIDDGYEDFYSIAFPILRKYGVPATLYVTTDFLDGSMWFWWDCVFRTIVNTDSSQT